MYESEIWIIKKIDIILIASKREVNFFWKNCFDPAKPVWPDLTKGHFDKTGGDNVSVPIHYL